MNGGSRIIDLRAAREDDPAGEAFEAPLILSDMVYDGAEAEEAPSPPSRVLPIVGTVVSAIWIVGMLWLARGALTTGMPPVELVQFVAALCVPPALIGVLLLLTMRTSRAEAARFGATARAMRAEAASLEAMVAALGDRIEAQRSQLSAQAATLAAIGDGANARLGDLGQAMSAEVRVLETICGALSQTASDVEHRLSVVFDTLPRAQAETARMADTLTSTGLAASERTAALDAQLAALGERGRIADEIAGGAAARLAAHLARMESTSETAAARLDASAGEMSEAVDAVLDRAANAVEEARKGITAQGEAMLAMLGASQAALDKSGRDGAEALAARLAAVEDAIARIGQRLSEEQGRGDALFAGLGSGIEDVGARFARLHAEGSAQSRELAASISALTGSADAMNEAMRTGESTARTLINTAEDLLTALDASAREIDETLPDALARLDARIVASRAVVASAKPELLALVTAAESTHDAVEAVAGLVTAERKKLVDITATLSAALDAGQDKAETMDAVVGEATAKARRFAEEAAPQLVDALNRIRESAVTAADTAREVLTGVLPSAARAIEDASADAVRRAFDHALPQPLAELGSASEAAVDAATRASERLSQQLMTIAETTAAIEARIDAERSEREASNQDNFARRVSLLIEALNSSSIDITKTFNHEVTDSAWAAYLKGDRGVFTRRAVRLLDNAEAREIARLHENDDYFRENVNRYIHDFEAMLRQILALRDGSPLGVTLLSSDMGKLYVALAQAIERLRA
jgi:hypothetical protein